MKKLHVLLLSLLFTSPCYPGDFIDNEIGMRLIRIPAGEFTMGNKDPVSAVMEVPEPGPDELADESPAHRVQLTRSFYIGQTEVTQQQWFKVMENKPGPGAPWEHKYWQQLPVASVSWYMAQRFAEELTKIDSHYRYRLPTEAEWEYVAKDANDGLRPVPIDQLEHYAWFINNSGDRPHVVATQNANRFGVYDMLGNVWEWVDDWYAADTYATEKRINPVGPPDGQSKVRRGGSFHCPLHLTRPGYRGANKPGVRYEVTGFRVVAEPK